MKRPALILATLTLWLTACADPNRKTDASTDDPFAKTDPAYEAPERSPAASGTAMTPTNTYDPTYQSTAPTTPPQQPHTYTASGSTQTVQTYDDGGGEVLTPTRTRSGSSNGGARTYVVKKGDTLSEISQRMYGTSTKWKQIQNANRATVKDPKKLKVGTKLIIP